MSVKLLDGGDTAAKLPLIEVVPGAPVNIAHSLAGKVHMGRASNATLTITVTDQHGNRVADGTGVSFFVSDSLEVVSNDGATTNGEASVVVTGSDFPLDSSINIVVGEASKAVALNVHSLNVGLELANSTVRPGGEESVVVTVTDSDGAPVSGVEVELGTNYGYLRDTLVTTDAQGKAETVFTAPQGERTGSITAQVGLATATTQPLAVAYAPSDARDLAVNHAALIGDKTSAGTIVHNRYDGVPLEIAYPTARTVRALGTPGDSVTVHIGDDFDPNLPPLAAYYMNHIYEEVTDETGRYPLHQRAVQIVSGTRMGAGSRYQFNADDQSLVYGDALTLLQQSADLGFSLEVIPGNGHTSEDGELVNLGQGALVLSYGDNRSDTASYKKLCPILFSIRLVLIPQNPVYNAALSGACVGY